jgi:hypothetical protein
MKRKPCMKIGSRIILKLPREKKNVRLNSLRSLTRMETVSSLKKN